MTGIIDPKLIDFFLPEHDGYPEDMAAEDTPDAIWEAAGDASREFPKHLWIDRKDWKDRALENDKNKTWPINFIDRFTNQSPTHECTGHGYRANYEGCRNRQRRIALGPPQKGVILEASKKSASVWISVSSVYNEANPKKWGGANVRKILEIACRRGALPDKIQPRPWKFNHSLVGTNGKGNVCQSSGSWVRLSDFPAGWEETAKHFKPLEVIFPEDWEQIVCLLLHGYVVTTGRKGHCIPLSIWLPDDEVAGYVDSYDVIRYDSIRTLKSSVSSAYAIASVQAPDDWNKPAGI